MKILLIAPTQQHLVDTNLPAFVDDQRGALPPLGLLYVAAAAQQAGHDVQVADLAIAEAPLARIVSSFQPQLVGITATTFTMLEAMAVADVVRARSSATIVLGGVHPSIYPIETLALPQVDVVAVGEGEAVFTVPVIVAPSIIKSNGYIQDLDALPMPDRTLTDYQAYHSLLGTGKPITTMITSRGCPYGCVFCHRPHLGRQFRARSADNVLVEFDAIQRLGIKEVLIYDDTFTVDRRRVVDICEGLISGGSSVTFDIRTRVNNVDYDLLRLLKRAGCKRIHYGVEASRQSILDRLNKGITLKQVEQTFKATRRVGIETLAYFILGSPTETLEDAQHTIQYARQLDPDYCHFAIMTPYPKTPLYADWLIDHEDHWQRFAESPHELQTPYWDELPEAELQKLLIRAYKKFYLRPRYIAKQLRRVRPRTLLRKISAGLQVLHSQA